MPAFRGPTVIALCGPAGSGKSTVADHLVEKYGASRYGFATPLKEMLKRALDFTDEQVYGTQAQKEAVDPRYNYSARWFMQRIGTEGCRNTFGEDFWTKMCIDTIVRQNQPLVVIEDMRFLNEGNAVLHDERIDGHVLKLFPVGDAETVERLAGAGNHKSEFEWRDISPCLEIRPNKRGIPELLELVDAALSLIGPPRSPADGVLM